ncbi:MAG: permease [Chthonomonadales bacterium]
MDGVRNEEDRPVVGVSSGFDVGRWAPLLIGLGVGVWWSLYSRLLTLADWITYSVARLPRGGHLASAVEFFTFEAPKVLMLLVLVVFGVGMLRTYITPERARASLAGRKEAAGILLAGLLGIITPFCSCSAVPMFLGFVESGVPLGVTFSFLIASPMINEVALVLLLGMFGVRVAGLYVATGLGVAMVSGWIIGRLRMERYLEPWVLELRRGTDLPLSSGMTFTERVVAGRHAVREIVGRVWLYVLAGIAVGAGIHGYVPMGTLAAMLGKAAWWSVPLAVLLGIPLYSNAAGVIPILSALLEKGAALGTSLAFIMAVIAISPPEMLILRKVLKPQLIAVFAGVVTVGIMVVGYLFNILL